LSLLFQVRRYKREYGELQTILTERNLHRDLGERLRRQRLQEFMGGFGEISLRLKEMYQVSCSTCFESHVNCV